jgi:hypothetical protein
MSNDYRRRLLYAVCIAPFALACSDGEGTNAETEGDDVPLQDVITVAGEADIRHGTDPYESPIPGVSDSIQQRVFVAFLSGGQEVPGVKTPALGAMALVLNGSRTKLRYLLSHDVEGATVAHLHNGAPAENGAVAVQLPSAESGEGSVAVTAAQVSELLAGRLYVNVHSAAFEKGEIRGQILRPGETLFTAALSGVEEVPRNDSAASGAASLVLSAARDQVRFRVKVTGTTPSVAHLHRGIVGINGSIVYALDPPGETIEGTLAVTPEDVEDLRRRQWYFNVHSAQFSKGELRGQVVRPGETYFGANMTSAQELLPSTSTSTNTGNAMVVLGMGGAKFLYQVSTNASPTLVHLHRGPGGTNGSVEIDLPEPSQSMFGIEDLGPTRQADAERGLWYFNVHTTENPKGEIRGQVLRPGETLYTAVLSGQNEVPAIETAASGGAGVILSAARDQIRYDGSVVDLTPTVAHIHDGVAGTNGAITFALGLSGTALAGEQAMSAADVTKLDGEGFYVNVHSAEFPKGAIRGQLVKK